MILTGDCLAVLPTLGAETFQTCITSPPYWQLRDYGIAGQHGMERLPDCAAWARGADPCDECFVCRMRHVFAEVHRVLRKDGTLWLNLGDTTASSGGLGIGGNAGRLSRTYQQRGHMHSNHRAAKLAPKNLMGLPWRVALALQADGWILRQDIIWHKKTPMPETVRDRPTRAHEYLFLLVKQRRYHYDAAAVAEPVTGNAHARRARDPDYPPPVGEDTREAQRRARKAHKVPSGWDTGAGGHREKTGRYPGQGRVKNNPSFDAAMGSAPLPPKDAGRREQGLRQADALGGGAGWREDPEARPAVRNLRSVWTLGPEPFKDAHFATFPKSLVRPCMLAGSRVGDAVLDPYFGSGTVGAVAEELARAWTGIELNPVYVEDIAAPRTARAQPGLPFA